MVTLHHVVTWTTTFETTPNGWTDAMCQHKIDEWEEDGLPVLTNAKYCFVRGVGKVYELTLLESDERLTDSLIPGCE
jgi:hypothetical protein